MPSLNSSRLRNNSFLFLILLPLATFILVALPLLAHPISGAFFAVDPDVVYLSNALSYIKSHQIHYVDHPGTPTILWLATSLLPFRILAKFVFLTPFLAWFIAHVSQLYYYARLIQTLLLGFSVSLFLLAVYRSSASTLSILLAWLSLIIYQSFLNAGTALAPEALTLLFISLWVFLFQGFLKSFSPSKVILLSLISGLATANKLSNLFVIFITLSLVLVFPRFSKTQKFLNLLLNSFFAVFGFILGTWPIHGNYPSLFKWVTRLVTFTGIHGGGTRGFFSLQTWFQSASALVQSNPEATLVISFLALVFIRQLIFDRSKNKFVLVVFGGALLGLLTFAKYPLSHYQFANYLLLVFSGSWLIKNFSKTIKTILVMALILPMFLVVTKYHFVITKTINQSVAIERYVQEHPSPHASIWEWGYSPNFALLWGRSWSGGSFDQELLAIRPDLLEIASPTHLRLNYYDKKPFFEVCWDHLYVQKSSWPIFKNAHPTRSFLVDEISGTDLFAVSSSHCQP